MSSLDDFEFNGTKKGLILWDIDGTLIRKNQEILYSRHLDALGLSQHKYREEDFSGLSDWDVLVSHARLNNLPNERLVTAFERLNNFAHHESPLQFSQYTGVEDILMHGIVTGWTHGILTGNVLNAAVDKLRRVKLLHYFDTSMFFCCEFQETRSNIAKRAKLRLRDISSSIILIGDTLNDVIAAKESGMKIILVFNGKNDFEVLDRVQPEGLVDYSNITPAEFYLEIERVLSKKI